MKSISGITGMAYDEEECVFFRNPKQSAYYIYRSAKLVDVFSGEDLKLVFVFTKADHDKYKMDWANREHS